MSDLKLFSLDNNGVHELSHSSAPVEKVTQTLIERHLQAILGVRFLASEHPTDGGRMDTLGLDENGSPVIIEYKRTKDANVINQGLFYLDWLMGHRGDFELLVYDQLGVDARQSVDWSAPRLICIAGDFNRYDEHAIRQMDRNIELLRYRRFGDQLLALEQVGASTARASSGPTSSQSPSGAAGPLSKRHERTISTDIQQADGLLLEMFEAASEYLRELGDDVNVRTLKHYVAFQRMRGFAWIKLRPQKVELLIDALLDPDSIPADADFVRDMRKIGHHSPGPVEIRVGSMNDFERAKPLLQQAYENA